MDESPRDCRRLHFLRGWSNVYVRSRRAVKIRQALGSALSLPVQTLGALPPYVNGYGETAADPRYTIGRHRRGCPSKLCVRSFSHASGIHASGRETGRDGSTNRSVFPDMHREAPRRDERRQVDMARSADLLQKQAKSIRCTNRASCETLFRRKSTTRRVPDNCRRSTKHRAASGYRRSSRCRRSLRRRLQAVCRCPASSVSL